MPRATRKLQSDPGQNPAAQGYSPPASPEAEQSVLGAILVRPEGMDEIVDLLQPADFFREAHGRIFQIMLGLYNNELPIDLVSVTQRLKDYGMLEGCGGPVFLAELSEQVGFATNLHHYAKTVKDKSLLRQLLDATQEIAAGCFAPVENVQEFIAAGVESLFVLTEDGPLEAESLETLIPQGVAAIEVAYQHRGELLGVPSGFVDLDGYTGGFQGSDLIIIAARPSMGKTSLALDIATHAAGLKEPSPGVFFSLEMSKEQLIRRQLAGKSRVSATRLRSGRLDNQDWVKIQTSAGTLLDFPVWIIDKSGLTPSQVRSQARRLKRKHGIKWIVIDYLQLMHEPKAKSREQEVSTISRKLKGLAKELNIPVIALSQLNRDLEKRPNKRPQLADLRESGSIEQDADVVIFIYREAVYKEDCENPTLAEVIVAKQRNGPLGLVKLRYFAEFTSFENWQEGETPRDWRDRY